MTSKQRAAITMLTGISEFFVVRAQPKAGTPEFPWTNDVMAKHNEERKALESAIELARLLRERNYDAEVRVDRMTQAIDQMTMFHYRAGIRALSALPGSTNAREHLLAAIVAACEAARTFKPDSEPRKAILSARKSRASLANKARALGNAFRSDKPGLSDALNAASNRCLVQITDLMETGQHPIDVAASAGKLLLTLAEVLEDKAAFSDLGDPGAFDALHCYGNLVYEGAPPKKLPEPDAMLAVELEFYLRAFSDGRSIDLHSWNVDALRAEKAAPYAHVNTKFVKAAFPKTTLVSAPAIQERINGWKSRFVLRGWPRDME